MNCVFYCLDILAVPMLHLLMPLELFLYFHLIFGILSLCISTHLTVLPLLNPVVKLTFALLPITSSHWYANTSHSTFNYSHCVNIWLIFGCRFGNHVNFIVGLNGSGKSSVLTAVMVGLGGRAALTSRGSSVKNLIKHGKRVAEVLIRLRNRGADAYHHDVYGDSIVISRKLTLDNAGPRSYRISSADNQTVSTKREELDNILDYFNIQVRHVVVHWYSIVAYRLHVVVQVVLVVLDSKN